MRYTLSGQDASDYGQDGRTVRHSIHALYIISLIGCCNIAPFKLCFSFMVVKHFLLNNYLFIYLFIYLLSSSFFYYRDNFFILTFFIFFLPLLNLNFFSIHYLIFATITMVAKISSYTLKSDIF